MGFLKSSIYFLMLSICFLHISCKNQKENLPFVSYELIRFEQLFYGETVNTLEQLQKTYPYFFPSETPMEVWIDKQKDSLQRVLFEATKAITTDKLNQDLQPLLGRYKNIFPKTALPKKIITLMSEVDYNNKVIEADSLLLISVDVFLGKDHPLYEGIPLYIRQNMSPDQILPEVAEVLSLKKLPAIEGRTFLAHMIYHGKKQWLKQQLLPAQKADVILGYTAEQLRWAEANEKEIWNYFASQEMLFGTQSDLISRFIRPAPFSKFYLDIDQESPGKIGQWLGLQIVESYAKRTNNSVEEIINTPYMELYRASKYKPRR